MYKRRSSINDSREAKFDGIEVPLYQQSRKDSKMSDEHSRWLESYQANCLCARTIEITIKDAYAENKLGEGCAEDIIMKFGFDRVNWVLAHTIQFNGYDARFSQEQISWAKGYNIPYDDHYLQRNISIGLHPSLVSLFADAVLTLWKDLKLYDKNHCYDESEVALDYVGKIVVVNPNVLMDRRKTPDHQLFLVRSVKKSIESDDKDQLNGVFLKSKRTRGVSRTNIIGVLKLDLLPDWAKEEYIFHTDVIRAVKVFTGETELDEEKSLYLRPTRR